MTQILEQFASKPAYAWADWADGRPRRAVQGTDFDCESGPKGFRSMAYQYAARHGLKCRTKLVDGLTLDFVFDAACDWEALLFDGEKTARQQIDFHCKVDTFAKLLKFHAVEHLQRIVVLEKTETSLRYEVAAA